MSREMFKNPIKENEENFKNANTVSELTKSGKISLFIIVLTNYFKYGAGNIKEIKFDKENNKIHIKWRNQDWEEFDPDDLWNK